MESGVLSLLGGCAGLAFAGVGLQVVRGLAAASVPFIGEARLDGTAVLFTAWHLPPRYVNATGAEGTAGDLPSVLLGTGLPVLAVAFILGWAWDRWRNLPALVMLHWGVDTLPSVASLLQIPVGGH